MSSTVLQGLKLPHIIPLNIAALLTCFLPAVVAAEAPFSRKMSYVQSDRLFGGEKFVALRYLHIRAEADDDAPIVHDIGIGRLIYAEPLPGGEWAEIKGAGARHWPDLYTGGYQQIDAADGMFRLSAEIPDRDEYYPQGGFVRMRDLGSIDTNDTLPFKRSNVKKLPNPWEDLGVPNNRVYPATPNIQPFDAMGLITAPSGTLCSSFLFENNTKILTAAHCLDYSVDAGYLIKFEGEDAIEAMVINSGDYPRHYDPLDGISEAVRSEDWAVLQLSRAPKIARKPLMPLSPGPWEHLGAIEIASLGYAIDTPQIKSRIRNDIFAHATTCKIPYSKLEFGFSGEEITLETDYQIFGCTIFHGDSGGATILWNERTSSYELIGINSTGINLTEGTEIDRAMSDAAKALFYGKLDELTKIYAPHTKYTSGVTTLYIPGIAPLYDAAVKADNVNEWSSYLRSGSAVYHSGISGGGELGELAARSQAREPDDVDVAYIDPVDYNSKFFINTGPDLRNVLDFISLAPIAADYIDKTHQIDVKLGDQFSASSLDERKVPHLIRHLWFGSFTDGDLYIKAGNLLLEAKHITIENVRRVFSDADLTEGDLRFILEVNKRYAVALVGGDAIFYNTANSIVTMIVRNYANIYTENMAWNLTESWKHHMLSLRSAGEALRADQQYDPIRKSGIQATSTIRTKDYGERTPDELIGGSIVDVQDLWPMIKTAVREGKQDYLLLSAMKDEYGLPGAIFADFAAHGTSFDDDVQSELKAHVGKVPKELPIVVYCHHENCWLSYNLALRLIKLGYTDVRWFRGGLREWRRAGLALQAVGEWVLPPQ